MMTKRFLPIALALLMILDTGCALLRAPTGQRRAERLAASAIKSLGGRRALAAARFLVFDFVVQQANRPVAMRSHTWDQETGRYRLEGTSPDGQPYVALFNVKTRLGQVFVGSKMQPAANPGAALDAALRDQRADTAWLFGVFRLQDPGVELQDGGQQVVGGRPYDVIAATAAGPAEGLLPGVQNWVLLEPESARPFAWIFNPPGRQEQVVYLYSGFTNVGKKLKLPARLERANSPWSISFGQIISLTSIGDNVFESVAGPLIQKVRPLEPSEQNKP